MTRAEAAEYLQAEVDRYQNLKIYDTISDEEFEELYADKVEAFKLAVAAIKGKDDRKLIDDSSVWAPEDSAGPVRCGCGGEAELNHSTNGFWFDCDKCWFSSRIYQTHKEAVRAWNIALKGAKG